MCPGPTREVLKKIDMMVSYLGHIVMKKGFNV